MTLSEVEANLQTLWTSKRSLEEFLDGNLKLFKNGQEPDPKSIALYADLISIGQVNLMESIYPACQRLISDFEALVYKYMEECPPTHFNLNQSAKGFSLYLKKKCPELVKKIPFLPELADYEWLELEVMEADVDWPLHEAIILNDPALFTAYRPVLNPTMQLRNYKYPISDIVDQLIESEPESGENSVEQKIVSNTKKKAVTLAIFREPKTHEVKFLQLGEISRFAIEQIQAKQPITPTYQELLALTIPAFSKLKADYVVLELLDILPKLEEHKLILGSVR